MALEEYTKKRNFQKTPEPGGKIVNNKNGGVRFVIQKHAASRLHYDLRLEMEGTLKCWAVPKGLPTKKGGKHLAVEVEDHPVAYLDFEGTIPKGEYGGGTVMVWDHGTYLPQGKSPEKDLAGGKLHFILLGKKLHGEWYLVRLKDEKQWLVIKAGEDMQPITKKGNDESSLSGKNMRTIAQPDRAEKIGPDESKAAPLPAFQIPMMAKLAKSAPAGEWLYEIKFDGWRALALRVGKQTRLLSRNENDFGAKFPEILAAISSLKAQDCILDGEIVALDDAGRSSFQMLQAYELGETKPPLFFYAFDLLQLDGHDLRELPIEERKKRLQKLIGKSRGPLRFSASLGSDASHLLTQARKLGLEGLIGKKAASHYENGRRSGAWIKLKLLQEQEFVIGGYTEPSGSRKHIGALIVGFQKKTGLTYASKVGTGFSDQLLRSLHEQFAKIARKECPFVNLPEKRAGKYGQTITATGMRHCHWVAPTMVCQVKFSEWTRDDHLRHPVFLGLREDKSAVDVVHEKAS